MTKMREHCWHEASITLPANPPIYHRTCCWCGVTQKTKPRYGVHGDKVPRSEILPELTWVYKGDGDTPDCVEREAEAAREVERG